MSEVKAMPRSRGVGDLGPTHGRRGHFSCYPAKALCQHTLLVLARAAFLQLFLLFTFTWTVVLMGSFSQLPANPFDLSSTMGRVTESATSTGGILQHPVNVCHHRHGSGLGVPGIEVSLVLPLNLSRF